MFKKIDVFYKDTKGVTHYLHSTNQFKSVRDAVDYTKTLMLNGYAYINAYSNRVVKKYYYKKYLDVKVNNMKTIEVNIYKFSELSEYLYVK